MCLINHALLLLCRGVCTHTPVKTRAGSPASTESNNFLTTDDATQSGSPHPPDSSYRTCCGVFSRKPKSRGRTAAYLPPIPQEKSRADVLRESQGCLQRTLIYRKHMVGDRWLLI